MHFSCDVSVDVGTETIVDSSSSWESSPQSSGADSEGD